MTIRIYTCRELFAMAHKHLHDIVMRDLAAGRDRNTTCVFLVDVEDPTWAAYAAKLKPDGPPVWASIRSRGGKPLLWGSGQKTEFAEPLAGYDRVLKTLAEDPGEGIFHAIIFGQGGVLVLPLVHAEPATQDR